jgi:hypothetical protein
MSMPFDPRAWHLFTGLALVSGCSGRTISFDGDSTDTVDDGETTQNPDSGPDTGPDSGPDTGPDSGPDTSPPECYTDADCGNGFGYYCDNGVCEYVPHHDGHIPYYDCYSDAECGQLSLCEFNYCQYVYSPPPCNLVPSVTPPIAIPDQALALAFVDVDDDGAQELVVATQTQLHVYENGSPMPVSHARGIESVTVDAMVGGAFDDLAGDDVVVLHDDVLSLQASDGLGNLLPAQGGPSPFPSIVGLEAGDFDDDPLTDLLAWGSSTTGVIYGTGDLLELLVGDVTSASARGLGSQGSGFTLLRIDELLLIDLGGFLVGSVFAHHEGSPVAQTSLDAFGEAHEVLSSHIFSWTLIEVHERQGPNLWSRWGVPGSVSHMRAGALDSFGESEELALIVDTQLWLQIEGGCLLPVPLDGATTDLVFGDHDGDGDEELAVLTAANTISIVDVE